MMRASLSALILLLAAPGCDKLRRAGIEASEPDYEAPGDPLDGPVFDGADADRPQLALRLDPVIPSVEQVTDVQFVPGASTTAVVLQKPGEAIWFDLATGERGTLFEVDVLDWSEQGLLGLAFDPDFENNGTFYVNYTPDDGDPDQSRVSAWTVAEGGLRAGPATEQRVLMEVEQPYQNHNAGQLAFGPDGYLYIGWGDGGYRADPDENGQDPTTLLGSMLRVDPHGGTPYGIPADNPFTGDADIPDEVWAYGLRNPWRYSFDPDGRLVIADVGQNAWEEVSIASAGDNLGWDLREARHCFEPETDCPTEGLVDPVYEYPHSEGQSITGGYVATGDRVPELRGKYVFGDFVTGRLWAIELPASDIGDNPLPTPTALGRWPILPSTFGRDAAGDLYVSDYDGTTVYRLVPEGDRP